MKIQLATIATAVALSGAAYANSHLNVHELFAMSNNSAAEILVRETSMGDLSSAQVSLALGNMSAAERRHFFDQTTSTQLQIIAAQQKTCLLYTSPSPRDKRQSRMPSSA